MLFTRRHENSNYKTIDPFFLLFIYFAHTNNYHTLHLQFITGNCYRLQKRKKKKKKDKVHKNTIVYILTIKRRLPILLRFYFHDVLEPAENTGGPDVACVTE